MTSKESSEKFQPRMVVSFSKAQLLDVYSWLTTNVTQTGSSYTKDYLKAIEVAELDENGEKMDEEGKKRLRHGITAVLGLTRNRENVNPREVLQVELWQNTPDERKLEMKFTTGPRGVQN